jgi:hypothetical protein
MLPLSALAGTRGVQDLATRAWNFGDKRGLIYTMGYVPFLRCYSGFRIPQPLEILENWGSIPFREATEDILRLTKLNLEHSCVQLSGPHHFGFRQTGGRDFENGQGEGSRFVL